VKKFTKEQEKIIKQFYDSISEEKKKPYLGLNYLQLGPGSKEYICNLFECDIEFLLQAIKELENLDDYNL